MPASPLSGIRNRFGYEGGDASLKQLLLRFQEGQLRPETIEAAFFHAAYIGRDMGRLNSPKPQTVV